MINHPLYKWMKETGRTLDEVAQLLGVTVDFINKFIRGQRNISKKKCLRLSEITGIPKQHLMFPDLPWDGRKNSPISCNNNTEKDILSLSQNI